MLRSLLFLSLLASAWAAENPDWTTPLEPFQIADNLYYVGSRDLASYLVTTSEGNILINANLESSPPLIRASVEKLGFRWNEIKIFLNSQAHFDHVAGAAQVLRETGAQDLVMAEDAEVMRSGGKSDFAAGSDGILTYPPAPVNRELHDGEVVKLGDMALTAHKTAGHTRGCTTWTWPTTVRGQKRNVVLVGGLMYLPQYRLVDRPGQPASYPGIADDFRRTFAEMPGYPCDIFLGAHGMYFDMLAKLQRVPAEGQRVWIDPDGYQKLLEKSKRAFEAELSRQASQPAAAPVRDWQPSPGQKPHERVSDLFGGRISLYIDLPDNHLIVVDQVNRTRTIIDVPRPEHAKLTEAYLRAVEHAKIVTAEEKDEGFTLTLGKVELVFTVIRKDNRSWVVIHFARLQPPGPKTFFAVPQVWEETDPEAARLVEIKHYFEQLWVKAGL
ncbi:MAG: subclass B3 metallo-beta-lactamase [Candidatus Eremiobacteraeota bacterium]|nr:subclass B3 metallo-beta-lactamase [Candidatus Eremiobacteraeota bacterium]MCW5868610.1 subclass B3 metallo-beta-lactamase [Candidatus Eremiobacteraeota bacterium]